MFPARRSRPAKLPLEPNQLIVTADDFGLATEVNQAVEIAHCDGVLTAASLMVAGPAVRDALERARRMPSLCVGLHLVLVEGRPTLPPDKIPHLVGDDGHFRTDMIRMGFDYWLLPSVRRQASAEILAQFESFYMTGLKLDHVSAHKHFHLHPVIAANIISIGMNYGMQALRIPFELAAILERADKDSLALSSWLMRPWQYLLRRQAQRAGLIIPAAAFGLNWSGAMTSRRLAALTANVPPGIVEIYMHPATSNDFAGHAPGYAYTEELAALMCEAVRHSVRLSKHCSGGYSDLE
jgi:chitin disaccharide deacetylase